MRGDNATVMLVVPVVCPVHPHVRGDNRLVYDQNLGMAWFTPTCVGTTRVGAVE